MRHGAQIPGEKTEMMQLPHNMTDPITNVSLAESFGEGLVWRWIKDVTGQNITLETSENIRSAQVGVAIAEMAALPFAPNRMLNCLNYPLYPKEVLHRLGIDEKGSVLWEEHVVNEVFGQRAYQTTMLDMDDLVDRAIYGTNTLLCITHTQQIQALAILVGEEPARPDELGGRFFFAKSSLYVPKGFRL